MKNRKSITLNKKVNALVSKAVQLQKEGDISSYLQVLIRLERLERRQEGKLAF